MSKNQDIERVLALMEIYLSGKYNESDFCSAFENDFNFEIDKAKLSDKTYKCLLDLFNIVVFFSPFPEEVRSVPNYIGKDKVRSAVVDAREKLLRSEGRL